MAPKKITQKNYKHFFFAFHLLLQNIKFKFKIKGFFLWTTKLISCIPKTSAHLVIFMDILMTIHLLLQHNNQKYFLKKYHNYLHYNIILLKLNFKTYVKMCEQTCRIDYTKIYSQMFSKFKIQCYGMHLANFFQVCEITSRVLEYKFLFLFLLLS